LKVAVGSTNPVKVNAVKEALKELGIRAEVVGLEVPSGVHSIPFNDEVFEGAKRRAEGAAKVGDVGVGPESGLVELDGKLFMVSVVAVKYGGLHFGLSPGFQIPESWAERIRRDRNEFFNMMKEFGGLDLGRRGGLVSILTKGVVTRTQFCKMGAIMALSKAFNEAWR
jgi:inosine/xanthosine triphosphatase